MPLELSCLTVKHASLANWGITLAEHMALPGQPWAQRVGQRFLLSVESSAFLVSIALVEPDEVVHLSRSVGLLLNLRLDRPP